MTWSITGYPTLCKLNAGSTRQIQPLYSNCSENYMAQEGTTANFIHALFREVAGGSYKGCTSAFNSYVLRRKFTGVRYERSFRSFS